jgi:hypothetical protein
MPSLCRKLLVPLLLLAVVVLGARTAAPQGSEAKSGLGSGPTQASGTQCKSDADCGDPKKFCHKVTGKCDGPGTCAERPEICPFIYFPVCGCDGRTYGNACDAFRAGVSVRANGACPTNCSTNKDCKQGDFCAKPVGGCSQRGRCAPRPEKCIEIFDPVCGCDGKTYGNGCFAAANGTGVAHQGACKKKP